MSKTPLTVPPHMRLRPDHVGVYDEVVLASDYAKLETDRAELVEALNRHIKYFTDASTNRESWAKLVHDSQALLARLEEK